MKSKINIKSIIIMAVVGIISLFFINMSLAANTGKICVETANLRETAGEDSKILELLSMNEEVEVIEKTGDWYKVKAKGITGYLRQDLITVNGEVADSNTTSNDVLTETIAEDKEVMQTIQAEENTELGKQKVVEDTKLKIVPVINATDIIEVKKDEEVNVIEIVNGWACIETKTTKGWIRKEKLQKEEEQLEQVAEPTQNTQEVQQAQTVIKTLFVNATTVNLRKEASTSSEIVTSLPVNTAVDVIAESDGWSQVKISGKEGFISSSLLSTTKQETSRSATTPRKADTTTDTTNQAQTTATEIETKATTSQAPVAGNGASVVAYAKQFIGTKYTYGGSSPSSGFDCSGFTSYVYKHFGVNLPRTSGGQSSVGVAVNRSDLAPGDLVIYSGHVAIYVGGNQVIHAPRPGKTVCIVPLNQAASTYLGARRVI